MRQDNISPETFKKLTEFTKQTYCQEDFWVKPQEFLFDLPYVRINSTKSAVFKPAIDKVYLLKDDAIDQILDLLDMRKSFYEKNNRWLNNLIFNNTLKKYYNNRKLLFRAEGNTIRAVFTDRYMPIDDIDIANMLQDQNSNFRIDYVSSGISSLINIRHIDNNEFAITDNDLYNWYISIVNSEIGHNQLSLNIYILRQVCSNSLIVPISMKGYTTKHVVSKTWLSRHLYKLYSKGAEMIEEIRSKLTKAKNIEVRDPEEIIDKLNKKLLLQPVLRPSVFEAFKHEANNNAYGIMNAYTRVARDSRDIDTRLWVMSIASKILNGVYKDDDYLNNL